MEYSRVPSVEDKFCSYPFYEETSAYDTNQLIHVIAETGNHSQATTIGYRNPYMTLFLDDNSTNYIHQFSVLLKLSEK